MTQMPICDVCNKELSPVFYVLTTTQVMTSEAYWQLVFTIIKEIDPEGKSLMNYIKKLASSSTGWAICEDCIRLFNVDRNVASEYANKAKSSKSFKDYRPPGGGPADLPTVASTAAKAWKKLYGKWPKSIVVVTTDKDRRNVIDLVEKL